MKKFEILQELPKCDTETQSEQNVVRKMAPIDLLDAGLPQTFNLWKCTICEVLIKHSTTKRGVPVGRMAEGASERGG